MLAEESDPTQRLKIAWLAWKNLNQLGQEPYSNKFLEVWRDIKESVMICFKMVDEDFSSISKAFPKFDITMEPVAWQFEDTSDSLIFNAWALLFTTTGDNHWLVPQLSIHIASGLIHEYQHFAFLKEHNMLKRSEEESETFKKEYEKQMETLSSQKEIDFLRKSLNIDFDIKHIPLFRVYEWTNEGSPERMDKYRCSFTDDEYRQDIMCLIQDRKDRLKDVQTDKYEVEATSFNREAFIQTSKLLSLDPKMNGSDKRRITFDF